MAPLSPVNHSPFVQPGTWPERAIPYMTLGLPLSAAASELTLICASPLSMIYPRSRCGELLEVNDPMLRVAP